MPLSMPVSNVVVEELTGPTVDECRQRPQQRPEDWHPAGERLDPAASRPGDEPGAPPAVERLQDEVLTSPERPRPVEEHTGTVRADPR
jgi:hypothetical protein